MTIAELIYAILVFSMMGYILGDYHEEREEDLIDIERD